MFMYIGGMQMTPGARYAPSRIAEPPGTIRTPAVETRLLQRQRVLVVERPAAVIGEQSTMSPNLKPSRMPLHPRVDAPSGWCRWIGLGGAHLAHRQCLAEPGKRRARLVTVRRGARRGEPFDVSLSVHASSRASAACRAAEIRRTCWIFSLDSDRGDTIGSR